MAIALTDAEPVSWVSAHLHSSISIRDVRFDRFLVGPVKAYVNAQIERLRLQGFFFVRFNESGDHLRLRLLLNTADALEASADLEAAVRRWNWGSTAETKIHLRWVEYVPEVARYGGIHAIGTSESFFCQSSQRCIELLGNLELSDRKARLGLALTAMLALLAAAVPNGELSARYLSQYSSAHLRSRGDAQYTEHMFRQLQHQYNTQANAVNEFVARLWQELDSDNVIDSQIGEYKAAASEYIRRLRQLHSEGRIAIGGNTSPSWSTCIGQIVMSAMHMTNNRIGVAPSEEMYLAHIAAEALRTRTDAHTNRG